MLGSKSSVGVVAYHVLLIIGSRMMWQAGLIDGRWILFWVQFRCSWLLSSCAPLVRFGLLCILATPMALCVATSSTCNQHHRRWAISLVGTGPARVWWNLTWPGNVMMYYVMNDAICPVLNWAWYYEEAVRSSHHWVWRLTMLPRSDSLFPELADSATSSKNEWEWTIWSAISKCIPIDNC